MLQLVEQNAFDMVLKMYVKNLENNTRFNELLKEMKSSPLYTVKELIAYVNGRQAEYEEDTASAIAFYNTCGGFYDSFERCNRLDVSNWAALYEEAQELLRQGMLKEAYDIFRNQIPGYEDSNDFADFIEENLEINDNAAEEMISEASSSDDENAAFSVYVVLNSCNIRKEPTSASERVGVAYWGNELKAHKMVTAVDGAKWYQIDYNGGTAYVSVSVVDMKAPLRDHDPQGEDVDVPVFEEYHDPQPVDVELPVFH